MIQTKINLPLLILLSITQLTACKQNAKTNTMEQSTIAAAKSFLIQPSATSSQNDFDFLEGKWKVHNRKLKTRLNNSNEWAEFESELHMRKTLAGTGNVENYYAVFDGKPFEGMAIRLFNAKTKLWTIYWVDNNGATMDEHPVTGSFEKGLGKFYANDVFNEKEIVVLYQWDTAKPDYPKWSQAFSTDNGKTWEWNWEMTLTKID
ncbi:MAG: hypothetical protein ABL872_14935 [Lacibacter sp.]